MYDPTQIAYSTCHIHKILTIDDWAEHPNDTRPFSQPYVPSTFNYWDYQQAWYNAFYQQNKAFSHSWLFYFSNKFDQNPPVWFANWWHMFGPLPDILPKQAQQGFQIYQTKFKIPTTAYPLNKFPHLYFFFQQFALAWIVQWEYVHQGPTISSLARRFKIKWWDQFKIEKISPAAIQQYFQQHLSLESSTAPQFLLNKSKNLSKLAATTSKAELKKQLLEALESLSEPDQQSEAGSNSSAESFNSVNLGNENEDDCYGVLPPVQHAVPPVQYPVQHPSSSKKTKSKTKK